MFEKLVKRGILVAVVMMIIVVLGVVAAFNIPVQMIPDLEVRTISVRTTWPGATPQDVEKEILIEQEEQLRTVRGLQQLNSSASFGQARIELEFPFGIDLNKTLIEVMNALSRVGAYPDNANEPRIFASSFSANSFMFFRVVPLPDNPRNINIILMQDFIRDNVASRLESITGVSEVSVYGGADRQVQIILDPDLLAEKNLSVLQVRQAIRNRNIDVSGGEIESGKRRYLLRTVGRFNSIQDLEDLIVTSDGDAVIRLAELADIRLDHFEITRHSYSDGEKSIGMSVRRNPGSNVIQIKQQMMQEVEALNAELLNPEGMSLRLIADDVGYVQASIRNVWTNLLIGALLASLVMFYFLRSGKATLVGIMGIPVCTVAAFIGLYLTGRTINVISLAGVAFAIGMTLDNSIVVLESIEQAWRRGQDRWRAAVEGVQKVWPAVLASTLTTVMVFVPIVFIEQEAGQLYSDIAIAISASILASMAIAIAAVPAAAATFLFKTTQTTESLNPGRLKSATVAGVGALVATPFRRLAVIAIVIGACASTIIWLTPAAEYLPEGEEPKLFGRMSSPTGYNLETMTRIGLDLQNHFLPFTEHETGQFERGETAVPAIKYFNMSIRAAQIFVIAEPKDGKRINELMDAIRDRFASYVGMRSFVSRGSIISSNSGGTRSVSLNISGPDLQTIYQVALDVEARAREVMQRPRIRSNPSSLNLSQPLVEVRPDWERLAETGMSHDEMGFTIAALTDGAYVDELFFADDKIDIYLYSNTERNANLDQLDKLPVYTPGGAVVPLSSLARVVETVDTNNIRRVDGKRTVTLNIIPPANVALETAVDLVRHDVLGGMRDAGQLPASVRIVITGAGDQLQATREALSSNYVVALVIIYLLLVAIFSNWGYPLLIMTTIPLGIASGIVGLALLNIVGSWLPALGLQAIQQSFDMITMLGFLILMGTVVNNPILIVHQAMINARDHGMLAVAAVTRAVESRLRPIAMSTLTTVFGLAPLVFIPGAGTELYRGVGIVVLTGIVGTALVTLSFLPALTIEVLQRRQRSVEQGRFRGETV